MFLPLLLSLVQAPVLDGTIAPGEYPEATRVAGSEGIVVNFTGDTALFIAVRGTAGGFPHVALIRGDTVLILHASAALGTARYAGPDEVKRRLTEFVFAVRDPSQSDRARASRQRFYAAEGWVASTISMGTPGETEFVVSRMLVQPGDRIAVAWWAEDRPIAGWPAALADGVVEERVVQGFLPDSVRFRPGEWGRIPPQG